MNNAYIAGSLGIVLILLSPWLLFGIAFFASIILASAAAILLFGAPYGWKLIEARNLGAKSGLNPRDLASAQNNRRQDGQEDS